MGVTIKPTAEGFSGAIEQIRLISEGSLWLLCGEGILRLGTWRSVGIWVTDLRGFGGKKVEVSVGHSEDGQL